jgi:hypothetical protein
MRHQLLRRTILQLLYQRAMEAPQSLIAGVEAREIVLQLGITAHEFAFNALYLDGKGLITNDRSSHVGDLQFNAIMITPAGIDAIENPAHMERMIPLTRHTGARTRRIKSQP